jgi:putative transposase
MVNHPGEYAWSSYASNAAERQFAYRELFRRQFAPEQVHAIREALNQELVLGREDFKDKIALATARQTHRGIPGRPCAEEEEAIYYVF